MVLKTMCEQSQKSDVRSVLQTGCITMLFDPDFLASQAGTSPLGDRDTRSSGKRRLGGAGVRDRPTRRRAGPVIVLFGSGRACW